MILDKLAAAARARVAALRNKKSLAAVRAEAEALPQLRRSLQSRLQRPGMNFITEVKKASPSKGIIAAQFDYLRLAREYEAAGAAAISCLTEPQFFLGRDEYLQEISKAVQIPVLRKDFTVDAYQIYEAKTLGADAVLLICALLDTAALREYLAVAASIGLEALVEAHDEQEVASALAAGAQIIGVNNRNLQDFSVDLHNSLRLRRLVPAEKVFVSESGIKTAADVAALRDCGVNGVLIGETLMRSSNISLELQRLAGAAL